MSMGKGSGDVQMTSQQRANLDIANQQIQDWRTRWSPVLKTFAKNTEAAFAPDSRERRHATSLAGADTSMRFAQAGEKLTKAAAATGSLGSARQKLGITGMGDDQATSAGFGAVQADQAVDDSYIAGEKAVTSLARGEKADTINALGRSANISAQQAEADANASLNERAGFAGLASKMVGTGAGLWLGGGSGVNAGDLAEANASNDPIGALNARKGWTG